MKNFKLAGVLWLLALIAVVFVAWGLARDRLSLSNWNMPLQYEGDGLFTDAFYKSGCEGTFIPLITEGSPRLGAPYEASWYDYPSNGKFIYLFLGWLSKVIGFFPATNLGTIFAHVAAAVAFYAVCRLLRHSRLWSLVGAALFALAYYASFRNWSQLQLVFYYTLPFAMLTVWLVIASKRMQFGDRFFWICVITSFFMGIGLPYYLGMFGQFMCFAVLAQFFGRRRKENLQIGFLSMGVAVVTFLVLNCRTLIYHWVHGPNALVLMRNYFETELYALKPIEFFVPPPTHHIQAMADIGNNYIASAWVKGEITSPYLGLVVILGLVWVFAEVFFILIRKPNLVPPRRFPPYGPQITWIIFYCVIGGINCLLGLYGFQLFRASNRYSIFVSLLVLMFLVARMSVLSRRWKPQMNYALAAVVLLVGLYDQLPRSLTPEKAGSLERAVVSDRSFGEKLEEKLPHGAMVFQLPVMEFPEGLPIRNVCTYEMFRPYLFTKTLRFSYGAMRGRPREDWQFEAEKLPVPQMLAELERYGFSALYLNRKCFADQGEDIIRQLAAAGRTQVIDDDLHEQVVVMLNPSPHPELPHTDDRAPLVFKKGWVSKQRALGEGGQWADGDATLNFFSEQKQVTSYSLKCAIGSISPRRVSIALKGREIWSGEIPAGKAEQVNISVDGWPGNNTIQFSTDQPPVRPNESTPPLAFTVINLQITRTSPAN